MTKMTKEVLKHMDTVTYEGDLAPVVKKFEAINWKSSADGKDYIFDAKQREWVELNEGDVIVNSEDGYYVGNEDGKPAEAPASGAEAQRSAVDTAPEATEEASEDEPAPDVVTSDDTKNK